MVFLQVNLTQHISRAHGGACAGDKPSVPSTARVQRHAQQQQEEEPRSVYMCDLCEKSYSNMKALHR